MSPLIVARAKPNACVRVSETFFVFVYMFSSFFFSLSLFLVCRGLKFNARVVPFLDFCYGFF